MESVRTEKTSMEMNQNELQEQARATLGARMCSKAIRQTVGTPYSEFLLQGIIFLIGRCSGTWLAGGPADGLTDVNGRGRTIER